MTKIHPTAIVAKEAELGAGVEVGPYSIIGPWVKIGDNCFIGSHASIEGRTQIGRGCRFFKGVSIGTPAQVLKSGPVDSSVVIGDDNLFREYATVNAAMKEGAKTIIGNRNMLMINAHVGHDCVLGDDIVIANGSALGGHVLVESGAFIGGLVGVHQFVRIGKLAMVGGVSKAGVDVAPFSMYDGRPAKFYGINAVGLKRAGYKSKQMMEIKTALKALMGEHSNMADKLAGLEKEHSDNPDIQHLISFVKKSKRGIGRDASES